jgi:hypothetical protein
VVAGQREALDRAIAIARKDPSVSISVQTQDK